MKLEVGKRYKNIGLILAGFVIFLSFFLIITQHNSFFSVSADTTTGPDAPPSLLPNDSSLTTSATSTTDTANDSSANGVSLIYIDSDSNCPNCSAQLAIMNKLQDEFQTEVSAGQLSFNRATFESNAYYATIMTHAQLPIIIIKVDGNEVGRFSGMKNTQSQTALANQIKAALNLDSTTASSSIPNPSSESSKTIDGFTITGEPSFSAISFTSSSDCTINASATIVSSYLTGTDPVTTVIFTNNGVSQTSTVDSKGIASTVFKNTCADATSSEPDSITNKPSTGPGNSLLDYHQTTTPTSLLFKNLIPTAHAQTTNQAAQAKTKSGKVVSTGTTNNSSNTTNTAPTSPTNSATCGQNQASTGLGINSLFNSLNCLSQDKAGGDATANIYARVANVINLLLGIASAAMVFGLVWSGLLYLSSMGNEEQTKKAKSNLIMLVYGLAILLGSFTIVNVIKNILAGTGITG